MARLSLCYMFQLCLFTWLGKKSHGYVKKTKYLFNFHYYTVSLLPFMSNQYMYQISFVPLCENQTSHKTFKESYQKLQNLLYNLLDKNYLLFSDIVETNTQQIYFIFIFQTNLLGACASDRSILLYDLRGSTPLRKVQAYVQLSSVGLYQKWNCNENFSCLDMTGSILQGCCYSNQRT